MKDQPTREALNQRIQDLEKERQELKEEINRQTALLADAQAALEKSWLRYQALFETANDALFIENDHDEILEVNQKACDLLGYTREELLSMTVADIQAPECRGQLGSILTTEVTESEGRPFEAVDLHKDGTRIPVEVTNNRLEKAGLHLSIVRDIRERKEAERAREEAFNIIENSPVAAFLWRNEPDWPVEYVSRNVKLIFGYSAEDFMDGRVLYSQVMHPDDLDRLAREVKGFSIESDRTEFTHKPYRIVTQDRSFRWVNVHTFIRRDSTGAITHYQGLVEDITVRVEAEQAVRESEEKFYLAFHMSPDPVLITRLADDKIIDANESFLQMSGYARDELVGGEVGADFSMWVDPDQRNKWAEALAQTGSLRNMESRFRIKNGGTFLGSVCSEMIEMYGEKCVISTTRDITEQRHIENELLKIEKLQSLGVLAGGIAHDFNNFLTGIIGNLSLAKLELQPGSPVLRSLNEMEKAAIRAQDLTQQLLTFSKGGEPVKHTANLGELVREAAQFSLRGSNVRCDIQVQSDLNPTDVDEGQISQTLHNLMINADQAMPDGGTVTIRGANEVLESGNPYALKPGNYICLSIQDQGMGIKTEYLKKIFDPYFTTKQKGSGLGLAVAYSVINKHDGQLSVNSKLGQGTTFTIRLPASKSTVMSPSVAQESMTVGTGRILVMDDEEFIREVAANMLTRMGYEVVLAADGQAALDLYAEALSDGRPYDAVILDLTVPGGMGGREAIGELQKMHPGVRAIVSSGYSTDPVMADPTRFGFSGTIKKPYLLQDMSAVLNSVIS